ncbi:hypothetical protein BBK36DRAFT_1157264 [Trichoderma citrinoviride]|uniref:Uncharacterized protein n=1 Tax=Trichoderma citrinoviride TaxID=58853 RepID=A0A2T4BI88_9HYPO|nr:hypothetical protein BBK36DRAFT_1157264 [Trichoderma citrinoviride]PTB69025.1 hypothetical protein BBK36DRAFT_1157264 [Trichoderma citrinoviride]
MATPAGKTTDHPIVFQETPVGLSDDALERARKKYRRLQKGYKGDDAIAAKLSKEQVLDLCKDLVQGVFSLVGLHHAKYINCYDACVDKCFDTNVLKVKTWSKRGRYRHFCFAKDQT